jgi:hypothetical protein
MKKKQWGCSQTANLPPTPKSLRVTSLVNAATVRMETDAVTGAIPGEESANATNVHTAKLIAVMQPGTRRAGATTTKSGKDGILDTFTRNYRGDEVHTQIEVN